MKNQEFLIDSQEHPLLLKERRLAWEKFLSLDKSPALPTNTFKRAENKNLSKEAVGAFIPKKSKKSYIVFVNGGFCPELSDVSGLKKCLLLPLKEAAGTFSSLVVGAFSKSALEKPSHQTLLNLAMHQSGAFLYVPPKSVYTEPLFILSIIDAESSEWVMPRLQCFVGAFSEIKIERKTKYFAGSSCLYNSHIDIAMEERALVDVISDDFETKGYTGWYFDTLYSHMKSQSNFSHLQLATTSSASYDIKVRLAGEHAEANISGLTLLAKEQVVSIKIEAKHEAPFCRSLQLYKNILSDSSQVNFQGKIFVEQLAQKTESYQLNRSILLSDLALSKSEPILEIFADDVKASHGSTSGQLDVEELFYLTSRGISKKEAKKMQLTGFAQEVTQKSFSEEQKELFSQILESYEGI